MNLQLTDFQSCGGLQSQREKASIYRQKKETQAAFTYTKALHFFFEHGSTSAFSWLLAINLMLYLVKSLRNTMILWVKS